MIRPYQLPSLLTLFLCMLYTSLFAQEELTTVFERSKGTETATYQEGIAYWKTFAESFEAVQIQEAGETDSGQPLHLVTIDIDKDFDDRAAVAERGKVVVLINNGIHPGEADGIEASMMLARDLMMTKNGMSILEHVVVHIIPFYNVGGALNRNSGTRANQNGPLSYGFRGNARNYDLNRDFIKADSRNARSFQELFQALQPDVFVDTHVSNGADYQYVLTLISTQEDKLGFAQGKLMREVMEPALYDEMQRDGILMTPFVNIYSNPPDSGWVQFMDAPRYSTGYASLYQCIGFMTETHMLKSFEDRVLATYAFLEKLLALSGERHEEILKAKAESRAAWQAVEEYPLSYSHDAEKPTMLKFRGYTASKRPSEVTGFDRMYYDREAPFEKEVPWFNFFAPAYTVKVPAYYYIPYAWRHIAEELQRNGVEVIALDKDKLADTEQYKITDYETVKMPYEGHYIHYNVAVETLPVSLALPASGYLVNTRQPGIRYIMETLEPQASDSWFAWNAFDAILQQKEHFSPYVFEDEAAEILRTDKDLKKAFEQKKVNDPDFAKNWYAQLSFIYEHTDHYELAHKRYPILRVLQLK